VKLDEANHAFVTGGASGIGQAIAQALAERGVSVTIADISAEALAETIAGAGPKVRGVRLDVRDRGGWAAARDEAEAAFGPVDILINNAGITIPGANLAEVDPELFDRVVAINLTGVFNGIQAFAPAMKRRGSGHIVNTASMAGITSSVTGTSGSYTASKFGVVGMSEMLRRELAPFGVGVTVLLPGMVQSNILDNSLNFGADPDMVPRGMKFGAPAEIAGPPVIAAIENDHSHVVLNSPGWWDGVEARQVALREAFDRDTTAG
jgi:NAD(P)-dependent dehydrogenase (short-subunit alcohol dehydrogenase family)